MVWFNYQMERGNKFDSLKARQKSPTLPLMVACLEVTFLALNFEQWPSFFLHEHEYKYAQEHWNMSSIREEMLDIAGILTSKWPSTFDVLTNLQLTGCAIIIRVWLTQAVHHNDRSHKALLCAATSSVMWWESRTSAGRAQLEPGASPSCATLSSFPPPVSSAVAGAMK